MKVGTFVVGANGPAAWLLVSAFACLPACSGDEAAGSPGSATGGRGTSGEAGSPNAGSGNGTGSGGTSGAPGNGGSSGTIGDGSVGGTAGLGGGGAGGTTPDGGNGMGGQGGAVAVGGKSNTVAVLWPSDGLRLNDSRLKARVLVAGVEPDASATFVFNGTTINGKNAANVTSVVLAIDGRGVATHPVGACAQPSIEETIDIAGLPAGDHTLTAVSDGPSGSSTTVKFTVDPTLPRAEHGPFEDGIAPADAECLRVDTPTPATLGTAPTGATGLLTLPAGSTWDPAKDGFTVVLGGSVTEVAPAALACAAGKCTFTGQTGPIDSGTLTRDATGHAWQFDLHSPSWPTADTLLYMGAGQTWAGVDLATSERRATFRLARGSAASVAPVKMTIGPEGGVIAASIDGYAGVFLEVPRGALSEPTDITLTLVRGTAVPGVQFEMGAELEPAGLVFAVPARITLQFGEVYQPRRTMVWTSPFTATPLLEEDTGRPEIRSAYLRHFSGAGTSAANLILGAILRGHIASAIAQPGDIGLFDLATLLASLQILQDIQQDQGVDMVALAAKVKTSLQHWVANHCDDDVKHPFDVVAALYYTVGRVAQSIGADVPEAIDCGDKIRIALCNQSCSSGEKCYSVGGEIPGTCCKTAHCGDGHNSSNPECGDRIATENCGVPIDCGPCKTGEECVNNYQCKPVCVPMTCAEMQATFGATCGMVDDVRCGGPRINCPGACPQGTFCDSGTNICIGCDDSCVYRQCGVFQSHCGSGDYTCGPSGGGCPAYANTGAAMTCGLNVDSLTAVGCFCSPGDTQCIAEIGRDPTGHTMCMPSSGTYCNAP